MNETNTSPEFVLVEPQLGENIGTAARAMGNFCIDQLTLVNPREGWPNEKAVKASSGAVKIIENAKVTETLEEALSEANYVLATTARSRDMAKKVFTPEQAVGEIRKRQKEGQKVSILFGRERIGLKNEEVALADAIIMAPVNPEFASLNIAQAVLLVGYEWLKQQQNMTIGRETEFDGPGLVGMNNRSSRPATKEELIGFFGHLERELDESRFFTPPEKRHKMVQNIRNMFQRMEATEQEIRTLRGIVASLTRAHKKRNNTPS